MQTTHLPCTNDDTREDPDCVEGHDWPTIGSLIRVEDDNHRIVGSEASARVPYGAHLTVTAIDTDIHCVLATYGDLQLWVDLEDIYPPKEG